MHFAGATVDGKYPAPLADALKGLDAGIEGIKPTFGASKVVQDFFHQQYISFREGNHYHGSYELVYFTSFASLISFYKKTLLGCPRHDFFLQKRHY